MSEAILIRSVRRLKSGARALIGVILFLIFSAAPTHAAKLCQFAASQSTKSVTFTIPVKFHVPRDTPVGSIVWESSPYNSGENPGNSFTCTQAWALGVDNEVSEGQSVSSSTKTVFPIGKTGLGWSLYYVWKELQSISFAPQIQNPGTFKNTGIEMRLYIKKIGPIKAGASVPNGLIGYVGAGFPTAVPDVKFFSINTSNEASLGIISCKAPDVVVKMGVQNRVGQFKGIGTSLAPVNFSIGLKECPEGINKVSYLLKPNTTIVDAARSVVALDTESTAKGVGLQILDQNSNPVALNEKIVFKDYDTAGGNFNIPLKAAYHQTASDVSPGIANSSVTIVMSYD
ncbi:fimbrial protein [Ralstonia sp. 1138]|uniref:fimbrial protein n=1 Tax=Ralstonia sp. 1138 TaxID=3156423 RepID=UPI0033994A45